MKNTITKIMIAISVIAAIIGLAACYTGRTAQRQIDKAHHQYPLTAAKFCADTYAATDSVSVVKEYIQGKDMVQTDTVVETRFNTDTVTVTRFITRNIKTTDTLRDTKYVVQENKAAIALLQAENQTTKEQNLVLTGQLNTWRKWALLG